MRKSSNLILMLPLLVLLTGCAPSNQGTVPDIEADKAAIRAAYDAYVGFLEAGDAEAAGDYWHADAVRMIAGAPDLMGREAIMADWISFLEVFRMEIRDVTEGVEVAGDLGVSWGVWDNGLILKSDPSVSFHLSGKLMSVWKRDTDGSWKEQRMIGNLNGPVPQAFLDLLPQP